MQWQRLNTPILQGRKRMARKDWKSQAKIQQQTSILAAYPHLQ